MMLMNYIFVPLLLGLNVIVPEETMDFNAEYLFYLNKTTVIYRERFQTVQLIATLTCQPLPRILTCLLQDIRFLKTLKYRNSNATNEILSESFESEHWFEINFNKHGVEDVFVNSKSDKLIKNIIKDIANQFNIGSDLMADMLNTHTPSNVTIKKNTGACIIKHSMNVYENNDKRQNSKFQIVPLAKAEHFTKHRAYIRIEKNRENCKYYSAGFNAFLNGTKMNKYIHTMEIFDDKLKMSTIIDGQLPDSWNSSGSTLFTETILLNLANIRSPQTLVKNEPYGRITITI